MKTEISLFWILTVTQLVSLIFNILLVNNINKLGDSKSDDGDKCLYTFAILLILALQIYLNYLIT